LAASGAFAQTNVLYAGMTNTSLGAATLTISGSQLVVGNLGSNGLDGVSIELPANFTALEVYLPSLEVSNAVPVGAYIEEGVVGPAGVLLGSITVTKVSETNGIVTGNFLPLGSSNFTVLAYSNGVFVAGATNVPQTDVLANFDPAPAILPSLDLEVGKGATVNFNSNLQSTVVGDPVGPVLCDKIYFLPEDVPFQGPFLAVNVTAAQLPVLTISGEIVLPVSLSLSRTTQDLVLQWFGTSILQASANLVNWSNMIGATSPFTNLISRTNQFFRISQTNTF
jgi:hypothetical protein